MRCELPLESLATPKGLSLPLTSQSSAHPETVKPTGFVSSMARATLSVDVDVHRPACSGTGPRAAGLYARACGIRLYPGSSRTRRRRGQIRTGPALLRAIGIHQPTTLALPATAHLGIACWTTDIDWCMKADLAYQLYYPTVRPLVCDEQGRGGVSRTSFRKVCASMATFAEWSTGRRCRPAVGTLVRLTGLSKAVVQRARRLMRALGLATEVLRGRQRTYRERMASWRVGDRGRGWASVWALHPPRNPQVSRLKERLDPRNPHPVTPHPLRGPFRDPSHVRRTQLDSDTGSACGKNRRASRVSYDRRTRSRRNYPPADPQGVKLASRWLSDPQTPAWARRHSAAGWARILAAPAAHDWQAADINQLIVDYRGITGHWIANTPRHPIKLLAGILRWHGADNLDDRPAAAILAQEAEALARRAAREACPLCSEYGWLLDADGLEKEPAVRCQH